MRRLVTFFLCLITLSSYANMDVLESTNTERTFSFSTATIPERASVRVRCEIHMHKNYYVAHEFYAYVTPYVGNFHVMAYVELTTGWIQEELGSKVYMPHSSGSERRPKIVIEIVGVTQHNESIIIDLSHTPSETTVVCRY